MEKGLRVHRFEANIIIDVLKTILRADEKGKLTSSQKNIVKQAKAVIFALAGVGIDALID